MPEETSPVKDAVSDPVPAQLLVDDDVHAVEVFASGRFEPVDGRVHRGGRLRCAPEVAALVRAGRRDVALRFTDTEPAVPVRLLEVNPWGGVRFTWRV